MRRLAALLPALALLAGAAQADPSGTPATPPPPPEIAGPKANVPATLPPTLPPTLPLGATPMSPSAFEVFATGKTLAYAQNGTIWGRETYLPGRHVMWRAVGEDCELGHWWPENGAICFGYEDGTTNQCWAFARGPGGLTASFLGKPGSPPARVTEEKGPVPCPGPAIGS